MAHLEISVGAITSRIDRANNAKAGRVLRDASLQAGYIGDHGDNQALLDFLTNHLVQYISRLSRQRHVEMEVQTARDVATSNRDVIFED